MKSKKKDLIEHRLTVGDVVRYVREDDSWEYGEEHIITSAHLRERGTVEFSTNHGAWFATEDFEFIRIATPAELLKAAREMEDDYDDDEYDDEEDE